MSPDIQVLPPSTSYSRRAFAWRFLLVFIGVNLVVWAVAYSLYYVERRDTESAYKQREAMMVQVQTDTIHQQFDRYAADALYWSQELELLYFDPSLTGEDGPARRLRMIAGEYSAFLKNSGQYERITVIREDSMEVLRVEYGDGYPVEVPSARLSHVGKDRVFIRAQRLRRGEVYASPLTLAMDNKAVVEPYKPLLQVASPVFDASGERWGALVLTCRAEVLLNEIRRLGELSESRVMLLNSDGHYLLSDNADDTWGFLLRDRRSRGMTATKPKLWKTMQASAQGQFRDTDGLYSWGTAYPFRGDLKPAERQGHPRGIGRAEYNAKVYHLKVLTMVPDAVVAAGPGRLLRKMALVWLVLVVVLTGLSWLVLVAYMRRKIFQRNIYLYAHYDQLTGVPNRMLFFDRLGQALLQARRYGKPFGLLYMDLDGFKEVNDSFGHKIGDMALKEASLRMVDTLRESDTVARMGGDEFVALLTNITTREDTEYVTGRLVEALAEPYELNGYTCSMSVSIGVALCPNHGLDSTVLVAEADNAMYRAKQAGKNTYRFADGSMAAKAKNHDD